MRRVSALASWIVIAFVLVATSWAAPSRQALRSCVDRWNQSNMVGWGPSLMDLEVRRLVPAEASSVGVYGRSPRCVASLARRLHERTFVCVSNDAGAYECSRYSDGAPPLRRANGRIDARGALRLATPLVGTHATPRLPWQRYPHVDGLIHPWTSDGQLRPGLNFYPDRGRRYRGRCFRGSEYTRDPAALKCVSDVQWNACYAPTLNWDRPGTIVACASEGSTRFSRFAIIRHS